MGEFFCTCSVFTNEVVDIFPSLNLIEGGDSSLWNKNEDDENEEN